MLNNNLIQPIEIPLLFNAVNYVEEKVEQVLLARKIVVKDNNDCVFLDFDNIIHLEAHGSYTKVFLVDSEPLLISKNIKSFEEKLDASEFIRTHKSFIVNINHVSRYIRNGVSSVKLTNGDVVPVAVRRKEAFDNLLEGVLL